MAFLVAYRPIKIPFGISDMSRVLYQPTGQYTSLKLNYHFLFDENFHNSLISPTDPIVVNF